VLGNGEQAGIVTTSPQPIADAGGGHAALVSDTTPADCKPVGLRRANSAHPPRGRKRKPEVQNANVIVEPVATEPKRAFTIKEAARIYSVSKSSLYNLIKAKVLPDVVVHGRRLLPRDAMEALIASKRP
jgi:excisionase family DNA binding protein